MLKRITALGISAACIWGGGFPLTGEPTTTTGPNIRLILAPKQLTSQTGFALMGEVGEKMARVNATIGYQIGMCQRLKLSVDQLSQRLTYDFANGSKQCWVSQIAGGAAYRYYLDDEWFDSIDAGGWYSNAKNRTLSDEIILGETTSRAFQRRIAGSEAWHIYAGTTIFPWSCATLSLAAVYDHVDYRRNTFRDTAVSGAGFALDFSQRLFNRFEVSLKGDWLQPYQHVGGALNWTMPCAYGDVIVGVYGDYTQGRKNLPNDVSYGIQLNLAFGNSCYLSPYYKDCCIRDKTRSKQDLLEWIADPAVMMPIVLAITDECRPPSVVTLPDVTVDLGPYAINVAAAFAAGDCFAVRYSATGLPPDAFIDAESGIIFGTNLGLFSAPFTVTVTGECVCGSATSSFVLTYETII